MKRKVLAKDKGLKFARTKPVKLKTVRASADKWFSRYIRLRDTQEAGGTRIGKCCTCYRHMKITDLDCGHFQSRRYDTTRWDAENSHCQCTSCNRFHAGQQYLMGKFIDRKFGRGRADYITAMSRVNERYGSVHVNGIAENFKKWCEDILGTTLTDKKWNELIREWRGN